MKVGIADLKAHLSEHLKRVRAGDSLVVTDRDRPIARIVPYLDHAAGISIRPPARRGRIQDVPLPPPAKLRRDPVAILLEMRKDRV